MFDLRPAGYVIGWLILALGVSMLIPFLTDLGTGSPEPLNFAFSVLFSILMGGALVLTCANAERERLSLQQIFILTSGVWIVLPVFGALPFMAGADGLGFTDAVFEAVSAMTTTGSTVMTGLSDLPKGILLWRGMLQWFGGVGIVVVAMVFLPELRVGGMQIFRSEGFDTYGKILPRAAQIARSVSTIYFGLTLACLVSYSFAGLNFFDALVHSMTTLATGGMANYDDSFKSLGAGAEYVAVVFMLLASLPFVRYVQLLGIDAGPLLRDPQVRAFLISVMFLILFLTVWRSVFITTNFEEAIRKSLFNGISILTGTGFASENYMLWGSFPVAILFFAGLVGGCAGSTTCSVKIFRYQILFAAVRTQVRRLQSPHGVFQPKYSGVRIDDDVLNSVIAFFIFFVISLIVIAVLLAMTGLDAVTSISGAVASLANIGPGLGPVIGPAGNYASLNIVAKWILVLSMLLGRLELMAVFVLFTANFWRR
ncbi:MAG: TrkH family potassium uptake protein [Pseudomonadota bacterium]